MVTTKVDGKVKYSSDTDITAIKAKTDNLPSDPADESLIEAAITTAHSTTNGLITTVDTVVDAIKLKTDALPTDPADESLIEAAITAAHVTTNGLITTVDTVVDAVKVQTDKLNFDVSNYLNAHVKAIDALAFPFTNPGVAVDLSNLQTASYTRLGAPVGASISADIAANLVAIGLRATPAQVLTQVQSEVGVFSGRTNFKTLLAYLGLPDTAGKDYYTVLVTDRLDHGTYGLSALNTGIGQRATPAQVLAQVQAELGVFSARTNYKTWLAALGLPDTAGKDLYTVLITDRLDSGTFALSALNTDLDAIIARTTHHEITKTFFSATDDIITCNTDSSDLTLPSVVLPNIVGTITHVYAGIKFRMIENTSAATNGLNGAQDIQVKESAAGAYVDAINLVDNQWLLAANTRESGDVDIGSIDIVAQVAAFNKTYNFIIDNNDVDGASLNLCDVQTFLMVSHY